MTQEQTSNHSVFVYQLINAVAHEVGEDLLLESFFAHWPPQRLLVTLQRRMKKVNKKRVRNAVSRGLRRDLVWALDGKTCVYCGKAIALDELQVDHQIPDELGGETVLTNLFASCEDCNKKKGMKILEFDEEKVLDFRKNLLYNCCATAWDSVEGRRALKKFFTLGGIYNDERRED